MSVSYAVTRHDERCLGSELGWLAERIESSIQLAFQENNFGPTHNLIKTS